MNMTVQLLTPPPYSDSERHNPQYFVTDRQTDDSIMPITDHILRASVRSAKNTTQYKYKSAREKIT